MLEQCFTQVSADKETSRHYVKLYQSVHLPTYFFGMKGLEPLYITLVAATFIFFQAPIKMVLLGSAAVIVMLYWIRTRTPVYRFKLLNAVLTKKGGYQPTADTLMFKGGKK